MKIARLSLIFPLFWQSIINSYTQIFFAKNRAMGLLIMLVTLFDFHAGISGIVAVLTANIAAYLIGFNRQQIINGLYGFNALLVGLGFGVYFQPNVSYFIILIFISILTLIITVTIEGVLYKYGLPFLSIPFLISIWVITLSSRQITHLELSERGIYTLNEMYALGGLPMLRLYEWFNALDWALPIKIYFRSLGAIFFQYHLFAGILIAIGLIIWSRLAFLFSVTGFAGAYIFYEMVGANIGELNYSYIGFNFILTSIAIGGFFVVPSVLSLLWTIITIPILAFLITSGSTILQFLQLSVFSLPFNVVVIMLLYTFKLRENFIDRPALVYPQQFNPEKNLYAKLINQTRLAQLDKIPINLPFMGFWKVTQGIDGAYTHQKAWRFAWDFEMVDEGGKTFKDAGDRPEDYFCFNKPVLAPADGYIYEIENTIEDNEIGGFNLKNNWGNSIVMSHATGLFSQMSHLKKDSISVQKGQFVKKGESIACCGNSGRSPYPHLHFQFQNSPEIGSHTLAYPITSYFSKNGKIEFHSLAKPVQDELVCNNQINETLDKALHFIPGQELKFNLIEDNKATKISWLSETDIYNFTYLICPQTGAKAYFMRTPGSFYFTQFEGDKSSILYHFYLGAYQIVTGVYAGLVVEDRFPLSMFPNPILRLLQDFTAPFYRFLDANYRIEYKKVKNSIDSELIQMDSEVRFSIFGKQQSHSNYNIEFKNNQLQRMTITIDERKQILERAL
jgi:urea transporter